MSSKLVFTDVRVFTGTEVLERAHVIFDGCLIKSVGTGSAPEFQEATVINKAGHTLLPGFIDAHIHADKGKTVGLVQSLRFGVTTVMDMHNETENVLKLKKFAKDNVTTSADFKAAGVAATVDGGWPIPVVTAHDKSEETQAEIATWPKLASPEEAVKYVEFNLSPEGGADYIKLMHESGAAMLPDGAAFPKPELELQKALIKATQAHGKVAVAHAFVMADQLELLELGINGLTHCFFDQRATDKVIAAYKKAGAWCNPTLAGIGSLTTEGKETATRFGLDGRATDKLDEGMSEKMCQCIDFFKEPSSVKYCYETVKKMKAAGVPLIIGSDSAGPGLGSAYGLTWHYELYLFVKECGFTPLEALHAGTALTVKLFGWSDRGRISEGLKADLVLVEGNPLEDIDATLNLRGVWRDGVLAQQYEGKI